MLNGCDILVATPHCLVRMLEKKALSLKRLCHLVRTAALHTVISWLVVAKWLVTCLLLVLRVNIKNFMYT